MLPYLPGAGWELSQSKSGASRSDHFLDPSEVRSKGGRQRMESLQNDYKNKYFIKKRDSQGEGLPDASLGRTVGCRCICGDTGPKESVQDLLAWAGLLPAGGSGHLGSFGTLFGSQRRH